MRAERSVKHDTWVRKEDASTYVVPHNAMFHILGRNPPQAACLGRSNAANFGTCRKRVDSTNEYIKIVLILSNILVGIGRLKALQLGVDGSELLSQKKGLLLLREGLVSSRSDLRSNFGDGKLLCQDMCDMLETQRRRLGGEKSYKRNRAGISELILPDNIPE